MTGENQGESDATNVRAVTRLTLSDFRCYSFLRLDVDPRPVVLTGPNGAGKTNVLEALSFLTPGRGLRRAKVSEVARRAAGDGAAWGVAATVLTRHGPTELGTGRVAGTERRVVRVDGQPAKTQAALGEYLSAVWLTPAMDRLFVEGASARRRFLDRLVFNLESAHAGRATAYDHALRERARLLKAERVDRRPADPAWLTALEDTMARSGAALAAARRRGVATLAAACAEGVGPFPAAGLAVEGTVEAWLADVDEAEAGARLTALLAASRRRDAESGSACDGPHRSDLKVRHLGKDLPVEQCSTGEQKAVLISIVLAQARVQTGLTGAAPMLLLDEIAAHLDQTRRAALFDELAALGAQSWLTGTDTGLFAEFRDRAQFFRVNDASVARQHDDE